MISRAFDTTDCAAVYGRPRMPFREVANSGQYAAPDAEDLNAAAQSCVNGAWLTDDLVTALCVAYLDLQAKADLLARQSERYQLETAVARSAHEGTARELRSMAAHVLRVDAELEEVTAERDDAVGQCGKLAAEHRTLMAAMKRITDGRGEVIDVG